MPRLAAAWSTSVYEGTPVCIAPKDQYLPYIISDSADGAIIVWGDKNTSDTDGARAQRLDSTGQAMWASDGVVISTSHTRDLQAVTDETGGVIVAYTRTGTWSDICIQRVDSTGTVRWATEGIPLCAAPNDQLSVAMVSDGAGGAICTWVDRRRDYYQDIYAQRINGDGVPLWTVNGVPVCTQGNADVEAPQIIGMSSESIVAWKDRRNGTDWDIYAQRLSSSGSAQWTPNGVPVCTAAQDQIYPRMVTDGSNGALLCWDDGRTTSIYSATTSCYAQRITSSGAQAWSAGGVLVKSWNYNAYPHGMVSDTNGGAYIALEATSHVYVQHLNNAGNLLWPTGVSAAPGNNQINSAIWPDGTGGAVIGWLNNIVGENNGFYIQRVNSNGDVLWNSSGVPLVLLSSHLLLGLQLCSAGSDYIFTWYDDRNPPPAWEPPQFDIFATHVLGSTGTLTAGVNHWSCY